MELADFTIKSKHIVCRQGREDNATAKCKKTPSFPQFLDCDRPAVKTLEIFDGAEAVPNRPT
jgi:hypothetical protein